MRETYNDIHRGVEKMDNKIILGLFMAAFFACSAQAVNLTSVNVYTTSPFGISNFIQVPDNIYPGDEVRLQFAVTDTGTSATSYKDASLNLLVPFLASTSEYDIGAFNVGATSQVSLDFNVPNNTEPGTYDLNMYAITDGATEQVGQIPLVINSPEYSNSLIANVTTEGTLMTGSDTHLEVRVANIAPVDASGVIVQMVVNESGILLPLGSDRVFISDIPSGSTAQADFDLAAEAGSAPGYYPVTFIMSYQIQQQPEPSVSQTVGLDIVAPAQVLLTANQDPVILSPNSSSTVTITVANSGGIAVRAVFAQATAKNFAFTGADNEYIGTLNLDDTATLTLTLTPKGQLVDGQTYPVVVNVSYKDASNTLRYQLQTINVEYTSRPGFAGGAAGFAGRTARSGSTLFGFDYTTIAGVIILLVVAFLGYRYYQGRKKK
jgi:hypothetical protein